MRLSLRHEAGFLYKYIYTINMRNEFDQTNMPDIADPDIADIQGCLFEIGFHC